MAQNPYAAPNPHGSSFGYVNGSQATLLGDVLAIRKDAALPDVCMKCGTHDSIVRRQAKFSWTPMWARLSIVLCTIVGLIAMAVTTKRATLSLPLCAPCNARWSSAVVALIVGIVALVGGVFTFRLFDEPAVGGVLFFVCLAGFIGIAIGYVKPRMLQVHKIDDQMIELKGFHPGAARVLTGR
jgi:hypothetical protein